MSPPESRIRIAVIGAALYTLEQAPDGSLKISGCMLIKAGQGV